ncbi:hypothetical protein [Patulibacter minatonensis]|uniref:hypothetical protein n=1 Tax=Patulibacter minatonensis TaxID=298163 RepID=UPI0004B54659|nr:hypothetical protein [Patulibacter minatonensis]
MTGALALGVTACGDDDSDPVTTNGGGAQSTKPEAEVKDVTGGITRVTLDAGFVKALTSLKVTPAPVGDANISDKGVASFPVTGGSVKYYKPSGPVQPYVQGELDHDGSGLSLTAGGKKTELEDFVIDPGTSTLTGKVSVDGKVAAPSAPLFFLDGRTLKPLRLNEQKTKAILEGTTVKLKQEAADLLNKTYSLTGANALKAGLVIGVAKITVPVK